MTLAAKMHQSAKFAVFFLLTALVGAQESTFDRFFDNVLKAALEKKKDEINPLRTTNVQADFRGPFNFAGSMNMDMVEVEGLMSLKR